MNKMIWWVVWVPLRWLFGGPCVILGVAAARVVVTYRFLREAFKIGWEVGGGRQ